MNLHSSRSRRTWFSHAHHRTQALLVMWVFSLECYSEPHVRPHGACILLGVHRHHQKGVQIRGALRNQQQKVILTAFVTWFQKEWLWPHAVLTVFWVFFSTKPGNITAADSDAAYYVDVNQIRRGAQFPLTFAVTASWENIRLHMSYGCNATHFQRAQGSTDSNTNDDNGVHVHIVRSYGHMHLIFVNFRLGKQVWKSSGLHFPLCCTSTPCYGRGY